MSHLSRKIAYVATPALALAALTALPAAPSYAADVDAVPLDHGTAWLSSQLTDGLIHNNQYDFDDLGLTVDAGLSMAGLGETTTASTISDALAPVVASYYSYDVYNDDFTEMLGTHVSAGSLAKAAAFAAAAGDDPTSYGGHDLIDELGDRVSTEPASAGRIGDVVVAGGAFEADYSNTIGQSFAARALDGEDSTLTDSVTDFLLAQQCSEGFFRLALGADQASTCDADENAVADTDTTALAILNLQSQTDDTDVQAAIDSAVAWLGSTQAGDGSFGSSAPTTAANANSTGLAGWALGTEGETAAATSAAVWLRSVQADDFGPCTTGLTGATGAIAYSPATLATGRNDGIVAETEDSFRRATAQALPALQWAPAGLYASEPTSTSGFVKAGSKQKVQADSLAPGQTVCFARGASQTLVNADADGHAEGKVVLASGSGVRTYGVGLTDGRYGSITFHALAAKTLPVDLKKKVVIGKQQVITVKGLAKGEDVTVSILAKQSGTGVGGTANAKGVFTVRFPVGKTTGTRTVKVKGEFGNRRAVKTFTIVKG